MNDEPVGDPYRRSRNQAPAGDADTSSHGRVRFVNSLTSNDLEMGAGGGPATGAAPALVPRGRSVGPGRRFGYIAVKVHRLEGCASRQLYRPMRARSPCRRELGSP